MSHEISLLPYTILIFVVTSIGIVLRSLKQPHVVIYILAGLLLGPDLIGLVEEQAVLTHLGTIGVLLLLFFVGMEVSLPRLVSNWKVAIFGTGLQILCSLACTWTLGMFFGWQLERVIVLGFVISLSSTAVVVKVLQERQQQEAQAGNDALAILLVQDLAIVPMLVIVNFIGGEAASTTELITQISGALALLLAMVWILRKGVISLPIPKIVREDHEIQVFLALLLCFGLATLTEAFHLSAALGAFLAGIIVSTAKETAWVHHSLEPFKVIFLGLFFVSIGMLIDLSFIAGNSLKVISLVLAVLLTNTLINAGILKVMGRSTQESLYVGAMLAQIGELSFLLAAASYRYGIINEFSYQATMSTIAISLMLSPAWMYCVEKYSPKESAS